MTDETRAPENWMLCYDVIVGRVEGRDITRRGRQPAADSFAPHFGDPVTALMLADDLNENFQAGSHWIEAENGSKLDREEHAIAIAARNASTTMALRELAEPRREDDRVPPPGGPE